MWYHATVGLLQETVISHSNGAHVAIFSLNNQIYTRFLYDCILRSVANSVTI